jgi:hypothetical protein
VLNGIVREGPLSFCQELLLYKELFDKCPPIISRVAYIDGPLDTHAFERAISTVITAHEALRTTWAWRQVEPVAQVKFAKSLPPSVIVTDLTAEPDKISTVLATAMPTRFSAIMPPHMRNWIFRRGENDHLWVFGVHHLAADALSLKLYSDTFRASYDRLPEVLSVTTSIEYAQTLRAWLTSFEAQTELEWWLCKLEQIPHMGLPVRTLSKKSIVGRERLELRLPGDVRDAALLTARRERAPAAALFLAAYVQVACERLCESKTCVITNVPGRSLPGAASTTGACYNSVPLVVSSAPSGSAAICAAADALFEALDHQSVPAALISLGNVRLGHLPLSDLIPVSFNMIDHPLAGFRLPDCRLWEVDLATLSSPKWGYSGPVPIWYGQESPRPSMDWMVSMLPTSVVITVEYSPFHADREDVRELLEEYECVLRTLIGSTVNGVSISDPGLIADWTKIS